MTAAQLEAVVLGRVVARGDYDAAFLFQVPDRKVKNRRGADADIHHIAACGKKPFDQEVLVILRTQSAVPTYADLGVIFAPQVGAKPFSNQNHILIGQILVHNPSNIIFSKDLRIHSASRSFLEAVSKPFDDSILDILSESSWQSGASK